LSDAIIMAHGISPWHNQTEVIQHEETP